MYECSKSCDCVGVGDASSIDMDIQCEYFCREFIEGNYVDLKKSNPKLPILIRECSGVRPVMFARYGEVLHCVML